MLQLNYFWLKNKLFPNNSRRKLIAKTVLKLLKHPIYLQKCFELRAWINLKNRLVASSGADAQGLSLSGTARKFPVEIFDGHDLSSLALPQFADADIKVSIIIPVFNQFSYTMSCLRAIIKNTPTIPYEVILVDDVSTDATAAIEQVVANLRVIRNETNHGFLLNCNAAAQTAKGQYILLLNNDTNVQQGWLAGLVDLMEGDSQIGLVGPKFVFGSGELQEAGGIVLQDGFCWIEGRGGDPFRPEHNYVKEVDYISGACILVRSKVWEQVAGFDEFFIPAYYEDTDLAFKIKACGYKVVYQPQSVVVHFESKSYDQLSNHKQQLLAEHKVKFRTKWAQELKSHAKNVGDKIDPDDLFFARDGSQGKKSILVIDWQVPQYDTNAGARCTYQYLQLFVTMGLNVKFIPNDSLHSEPYTSDLEQLGIEVLFLQDRYRWLSTNLKHFDYIYLQRPDVSNIYLPYVQQFKRQDAKTFYFAHDMCHLRLMRQYEIEKDALLPIKAQEIKELEFKLFNSVDVIHVVGEFEQAYVSQHFPTKIVRNIPLFLFDQVPLANNAERRDLLFVGGFGHAPNIDAVRWFLTNIFPAVQQALPGIKFYIVGNNPPADIINLQSEAIIVTGFVSDDELLNYYRQCRVLVIPLRFGAGVKGKILEGMQNQIPVITSPVGAEGLKNQAEILTVCSDADEFITEIVAVYEGQRNTDSKIAAASKYIKNYFSSEVAQAILTADFNGKEEYDGKME